MTTWAVIPVKYLHESKRRLAHLLTAEERARLIHGFLDNLLDVLDRSEGIDRTLVVTADDEAAALAWRHGARVLREIVPLGLNGAVEAGVALAAAEGATAVLVLPADLPFARLEDIEMMARSLTADRQPPLADGKPRMAICGDETLDGTNALLLSLPGDFTFRYGPGSFQAHLAEATWRGRSASVVNAPGLRFDLDTESDWLVYNGYLVQVADD